MDPEIIRNLVVLLVLFVCGGFFSAAEMAFSALNRARVKGMQEQGNRRAALVLSMHEKFDEVISTLLICNNAVAISAATVGAVLFIRLIGEYNGPLVSGIVITVIVVILTDIFPKGMAKERPESVAMYVAPILRVFMAVLKPINLLIGRWRTSLSSKLVTKEENTDEEHSLREQELLYMVEEAEHDGAISEEDSQLISNAIEFNDLRAEDILTPRVNMVGIPRHSSIEEMADIFMTSGYSRLPVYEESLDHLHGVVHIRDFLKCMADENLPLDEITVPPVYAAPGAKVRDLLGLLQKAKSHMAIVIDEYGGTAGLVTMEDILEQLIGDIYDENDEVPAEFEDLGHGCHQIVCTADIDKMFEYFNMEEDEDESDASTVAGWLMEKLGRIPEVGDNYTYKHLTATVTQATQRRAEVCVVQVAEVGVETHV